MILVDRLQGAKARNLGREFPTESFLQGIRN